ncbi:nucleoside deaminase [Odoribacter sp. OttesenSCG-928-G04]|nr:nucleoside deaminase [Odoribacter sp. OttesenSCG-928-G04]
MDEAIRLAVDSAQNGGGPFAALIVKDGKVIASSGNSVTKDNDPTAHAEVNAIRSACRKLDSFQLSGCELYTSCEPCPMCLGAIYWARPDKVYYASTQKDAAEAGFDDSFIYQELAIPQEQRAIPFVYQREINAGDEFQMWKKNLKKIEY